MNWGRREMVYRYWEKAQMTSAKKFLLRLEWKKMARTKAAIIKYQALIVS